jgi:tetratricopeptide (TPR) repeat protein
LNPRIQNPAGQIGFDQRQRRGEESRGQEEVVVEEEEKRKRDSFPLRRGMMMRGGREAQLILVVALSLSFLAPHAVVGVKKRKGGGGGGGGRGGNGADCPGLGSGGSLSERLAKAEQLMKSDIAGAIACAVHSEASGDRDENRRAELLFAIAATAHSRRMFDKAMECMSAIPEAALADWGQANHLIGVLKLHLNNAAGAIRSLRRASELKPTDALIYTALAQAHYDTNDPQGAVGVWERGCGNMPSHADGFFNVGILLRELGTRLEDSARSYKTAIRLSPQTSRYRYSYGNLLYDVGLLNAASIVYRGALRIDPGHEDASNNLGNALRQGGKLGEARAVFEAGIRLNPGNTNLLLNSGQVYQDLGLIDKVEEVGLSFRCLLRVRFVALVVVDDDCVVVLVVFVAHVLLSRFRCCCCCCSFRWAITMMLLMLS